MERNELITRLQDLYEKAENLFNDDKGNEAAELLKQEIPARETVAEIPGAIISWLDATSLLGNILLLLSRPDEALEYGRSVYEAAKLYLPGTLELIYAEELLGNCLYAVGEVDEAKEMFTVALCGIETEISEAEVLRDGIKEKLSE
jgi:tetratricopeptide (TPR) repeat protein